MENNGSASLMMMMGSYGGGGDHRHSHQQPNNALMMLPTTTQNFHPLTPSLPPLPSPLCDNGGGSSNNNHFMMLDNYYNNHHSKQHQLNTTTTNNVVDIPTTPGGGGGGCSNLKAKIMAHPYYRRLLAAYINCQKVGAPPEVVARLEEAYSAAAGPLRTGGGNGGGEEMGMITVEIGEDPSLDQFMEAYCEMLSKYEQELTKPFKEAMVFLSRIESQFKSLSLSSSSSTDSATAAFGETNERHCSSEEDMDESGRLVDPLAEDRELKCQLLRKYSGYLGNLKQEFMKKRKKGKLPKEARQQLLEWWTRHYKWPYPSESQKLALADATGLDQKQINNWFINQRKRHWKPSEDMQFVVMDSTTSYHQQHHPHYYMDNVLGNPYPMDVSPALL